MCKSHQLTRTQQWHDAVDMIDPFYGSPDKLKELLARAPTKALHKWLSDQIADNEALARQFFTVSTSDGCHAYNQG